MPNDRLTTEQAREVWIQAQAEMAGWIANRIRTMPTMAMCGAGPRPTREKRWGRTLSPSQAKAMLKDDIDLHLAIRAAARKEFFRCVSHGKVDADRGLGFLKRVTWQKGGKLIRRQLTELLRMVYVDPEKGSLDELPSEDDLQDELLVRETHMLRMRDELTRLHPADRELIMVAKTGDGGSYKDLAERRGTTVSALKTRACRLWREFQSRVLGEPEESWEKSYN